MTNVETKIKNNPQPRTKTLRHSQYLTQLNKIS